MHAKHEEDCSYVSLSSNAQSFRLQAANCLSSHDDAVQARASRHVTTDRSTVVCDNVSGLLGCLLKPYTVTYHDTAEPHQHGSEPAKLNSYKHDA